MSEAESPAPEHESARHFLDRETARPMVLALTTEARARLCFRAMALCLTAAVILLVSLCLHATTRSFLEGMHAGPVMEERLHVVPAALGDESMAATTATADASRSHEPGPSSVNAVVAMISLLLVADVVLAIGLIRATFSLSIPDEPPVREGDEKAPAGVGLPAAELLKAVTEAITTVLRGLPKR